jgi:hypothetical protein
MLTQVREGRRPGGDRGLQGCSLERDEGVVMSFVAVVEPVEHGVDEVVEECLRSPLRECGRKPGFDNVAGCAHRDVAEMERVVGELRLPSGVAPQQAEAVRPLPGDAEQRACRAAGLQAAGHVRQEQFDLPLEHPLEHGAVERFLGIEVAVHDELGDARGARDVVDGGCGVARVGEHFGGGVQDRLPPDRVAPRSECCGCHQPSLPGVTPEYTLAAMSNLQLTWSAAELLATHDVDEPVIAGGVRCHGGFLSDGAYVPPRTKHRVPAIEAWQQSHREQFGTEILDAPIKLWPEPYPSVAQTKYLLREGVRQPVITQLTRIGTVEGFGAMIRHAQLGDAQRFFDESIVDTAIAHLNGGLFEAHARDEAGWEREAGHNQMWFAARDLAFEAPPTEDETQTMLARMGIAQPDGNMPTPEQMRAAAEAMRRFPDLDLQLEMTIRRMIGILFIEVSAFHTFAWAEAVLSDDTLVADADEAARLVRCIRADETPHFDYLRTALTEMRDRTFIGESGRKIAGADVIGTLWDAGLGESLGPRREQFVKTVDGELAHALAPHPRRAELLDGFRAARTEAAA